MKNILLVLVVMFFGTVGFAQLKVVAPNGDVKIGDTGVAPAGKLHVAGGDTYLMGGLLGVGTTTPEAKLDVNGSARISGKLTFTSPTNLRYLTGSDDTQKMVFSNNTTLTNSRAYFYMEGNNTSFPTHSGEFVMGGDYLTFKTAVTTSNTGTTSMKLLNNGDLELTSGEAYKTGTATWAPFSDKRLKKNIKKYTKGLTEILEIRPVYFTYNKTLLKESPEYVGVVAQEVEKYAPEMVKDFNLKDDDGVSKGLFKTVNPNDFIYMLINSVQEQQEILDYRAIQIDELEDKLAELESKLDKILSNSSTVSSQEVIIYSSNSLYQNLPNPFTEETNISYVVNKNASFASIEIFSMLGQKIKSIPLTNGKGQIKIKAFGLEAGTYTYNLVIDNQIIESKKMVLVK